MTYYPTNPYEIFLYDHTATKIAMLQGWKRLEFIQRVNSAWNNTIYFDFNENDPYVDLIRSILPDYFIIIYRTDPTTFTRDKVYEGVHLTTVDQALKKGTLEFTLYGQGYTSFLKRRVTVPPAGQENDSQTGSAGDVLKTFVDNHFINPTDTDRIFPNLSNEIMFHDGDAVTYSGRYISMDSVAETVSKDGGITYGIVGVDPPTAFYFSTRRIWGVDRRINSTSGNPPMFFNLKLDNMEVPILSKNYSDEINVVFVGGQGSGTERNLLELENTDALAVSPFGRKEAFTDARNESTNEGLLATGKAYIAENKAKQELTFNVRQTTGTRWLRDWGLGDYVTAKYYDFYTEKKITEVRVSVSSGKDADTIELVEAELEDLNDAEFNYIATYTTSYPDPDPFNPSDYTPPYFLGTGTGDIAAIGNDGYAYITHSFDTPSGSGGPTWTQEDLGVSGTPLGFVGDPFSSKYISGGTTVDGWLVTTTDIYFIENVANVGGTRAVTSQFTFDSASDYRTIQMERGIENWVMVASYYPDEGVKACYTTDGTNWTEVLVSSGHLGTGLMNWSGSGSKISGDGSISTSVASGILSVTWTYPGGDWMDMKMQMAVTCPVQVTQIKYKVKRNETSPIYISENWDPPPANNWELMSSFLHPGIYSDCTYKGHDGDWAIYEWLAPFGTPQTINLFESYGGGWRALPNTSNPGGSGTCQFEITEVNGQPNLSIGYTPRIHVSGKIAGTAFVTAFYGSSGALYRTDDYGATWTRITTNPTTNFGSYLGGALLFPWNNNGSEKIAYWGRSSGTYFTYKTASDGTTTTSITPTGNYGPNEPRCIGSCAQDRNYLAIMGTNLSNSKLAGFYSTDEGASWTNIVVAEDRANTFTSIHIADDPDTVYLWGPIGVGYSEDAGSTIDDRRGNMTGMSPTPGEILCIVGV